MRNLSLPLAAAFALLLALPTARADDAPPPPVNGHFTLQTLDGKTVSDTDYRGKVLVVYFGYTFCPDVCPTTLSQIGAALTALGDKPGKFQPVLTTLDPARAKSPVM